MRIANQIIRIAPVIGMLALTACEKDYYYETPPPRTSKATSTLEARYSATPPSTIGSSFWKTADYLPVTVSNVSTNQLYGDGLLNLTGSYLGLSSFNAGTDPGLRLKAAYDNENIYILAEWTDLKLDLAKSSWLFNGPADPLKADSTGGWTGQRNSDHIAFAFEIENASSPAGTFSSVGCDASCHTAGGISQMHPDAGKVDLWNWSLALTAPLGYAADMIANSDSFSTDGGNKIYLRNVNGFTHRSGPAFEWDGSSQNVTLANGQSSIVDPAFYIVNKMPFAGDARRGDSIYHTVSAPGFCAPCHGERGEGGTNSAVNTLSLNKKSRSALMSSMDGIGDMFAYWAPLNPTDKEDVMAYMRGLAGVPGYYLQTPDGSNADIKAISNVTPIQIKDAMLPSTNTHSIYQVLFIRKLSTNNQDDASFEATAERTYTFGVALMDNDGKNHIGSKKETLTFK